MAGLDADEQTDHDSSSSEEEGAGNPHHPNRCPLLRGKRAKRRVKYALPQRWPFVDESAVQGVLKAPYGMKQPWDDGFTNTFDNHCHRNLRSYFDRQRGPVEWGAPKIPGQVRCSWRLNQLPPAEQPSRGSQLLHPPVKPKKKPADWRLELGYVKDPRLPVYRPRTPRQKLILAGSLVDLRREKKKRAGRNPALESIAGHSSSCPALPPIRSFG